MKNYIVKYGQSLLDVALGEYGDASAIVQLAKDNNLSITSDLEVGQVLLVDENKIIKQNIVSFFSKNGINLATDIPKPNKSQTITFPSIPQLQEGDTHYLSATASSGLFVRYVSSNPSVISIENNQITVLATGEATITAYQDGDSIYYPAIPVSQTLIIEAIINLEDFLTLWLDYLQTDKFSLRVSGGHSYAVNYTDGAYNASQETGSLQPKLTSEGLVFDGLDDVFRTNDLGEIVFCIVVAKTNSLFTPYKPFLSGFQGGVPYPSIMGQENLDIFYSGGPAGNYTQYDIRINNISTSTMSGVGVFDVISAKFGNSASNVYDIGGNYLNGNLNGVIKGILFCHTEPNEEQKTLIQTFLSDYYSL
ncbi:hypothetical protein AD998_01710 [bacterium 336/3]|nr:hypothetical protein AD998_01710 [bacterium 336/3]